MVSEQRSNKKRRRDENEDSGFAKKLAKTSSTEDDEHKSAHFRSRSVLNTCRSRMTIIDPNFPRDVFQGAGEGINSRPCSDVWASPRRSFEQEKTLKSDEDRVLKLTVVLKQGELRNENFDELLAQKIKDEMEHFDRDQLKPRDEFTKQPWERGDISRVLAIRRPFPVVMAQNTDTCSTNKTDDQRGNRMESPDENVPFTCFHSPKLCWNSVDTIASTPMHKIELIKRTSSASVGQSEGKPVTNLTQAKVWNDSGTDQVFQGHPATPIPSSDQVGEENQIKIIFPRHTTIVISPASKH
ncbi:unnamed protein product [Notodromas monacha]|uniref:Uncharacterized protein n=1 Tax=Notodromas monacha TaxID=399045 RepID=A0A7R9GJZ1_9CRUS|nr:unnamed protein product [Notodromas monacha]CAG0924191.1 unnamed protein product [Notodromas monacha]